MLCAPPPLLTRSAPEPAAAILDQLRWPPDHRKITVRFVDGDPEIWAAVANAVQITWNAVCGAQFLFVNAGSADIRVSFKGDIGWSYLGTDCLLLSQSVPTMVLPLSRTNAPNQIQYMAVHEFGHALGLVHEHQSPSAKIPWNVEAVYAEYMARGWAKEQIHANILDPYEPWRVEYGTYDARSCMHYGVPARLTLDGVERGGTKWPSEGDAAMVQMWYGLPPNVPQPKPEPPQNNTSYTYMPIVRK